ncbi:MAG: phytoene desaturase family protein [Planctomycetota bacterium]|jgi:phytoene dehydrogenase-like protein
MRDAEHAYDVILVGSGMGALTVASLMAQLRHKRVLVIERHFRAGGYTHDFRRGKFLFDTGLHYMGCMEAGNPSRSLFDLVTGGAVAFAAMPDPFERFVYPDFVFDVPKGREPFREALVGAFPHERRAIDRYLRAVRTASVGLGMNINRRNASGLVRGIAVIVRGLLRADPRRTTKDYLDAHIGDPRLRALLASQWGDYGLPPGLSCFGLHSMVVAFFMESGGYFPVGGSGRIAQAVQRIVERHGGRFLVGREVSGVLRRDGRAVGVRTRKPRTEDTDAEEYFAPAVVSDAGAVNTYFGLLGPDASVPFRGDLERFIETHPPTSCLSLFVGLKRDPRELGFTGANHWIYDGLDHDEIYAERALWLESGQPRHVYMSFHSLKNPEARAHSVELLSFTDYGFFERWAGQPWRRRDAAYQRMKDRVADAMIAFVDRFHPGFADAVELRELATPVTNEHFAAHPRGAAYGLGASPERYLPENASWSHPVTPVPGLFMTGADVSGLGVTGATMGGVLCVGHLPDGLSMPAVFRAARSTETLSRRS